MTTSLPRFMARILTVSFLLSTFAFAQHYTQINLLSDGFPVTPAPTQATSDTHLKNPWGLARSSGSPWWVSDNNDGSSVLLNATGGVINLNPNGIVAVPNNPLQPPPGSPTGIVFNGNASAFLLDPANPKSSAAFIFVTEDGTIQGWSFAVNKASAVIVLSTKDTDNDGAVYKGATIAERDGQPYLYVANFRKGRIEVYDSSWKRVHLDDDAFDDDRIRDGFAPFNIQTVGENIYVTYAKQTADRHDSVAGAGLGFVDIFTRSGRKIGHLQHGSWMNAPWGIALAPSEFGEFSHSLLVGNFGSGWIAGFNPVTGKFLGLMKNPDNSTLTIDGLWGLAFGNGGTAGPLNTLYFTAGVNGESDGVFGTLTPIATELSEEDEP